MQALSFQAVFLQWIFGQLWSYYLTGQIFYEQLRPAGMTEYTQICSFCFVCLEKKPKPLMTQKPDVDTVYMGESVSFECKVEISSGWEYLWYKDGKALLHNGSSFNIRDASSSDSGTYECMAKRDKSMYHAERSDRRILQISGEPKKVNLYWCVVMCTEMNNAVVICVYGFHAMVKIIYNQDTSQYIS